MEEKKVYIYVQGDEIKGDKYLDNHGTIIKKIEHYHNDNVENQVKSEEVEDAVVIEEEPKPAIIENAPPLSKEKLTNAKLNRLERLLNYSTPDEWIKAGIREVINKGLISNSYDWAAVYHIITEATEFESMTPKELVKVVDELNLDLPDEKRCVANNFRNFDVAGRYPKWKVKSWDISVRFSAIAKAFLNGYYQAQKDIQ